MSTFKFAQAVIDYRLLKNRRYPDKASLKLVGDRYRLTSTARNCLLRGVVEAGMAAERRAKQVAGADIGGKDLGIDWYNVLITVESYLKGAVLFLADDGLLRDSSSVHGSYRPGAVTDRAIGLIRESLVRLAPRRIDVFIDSPISHSKKMRDALEALLGSDRPPFACSLRLVPSADYELKSYVAVVASSDSIVIDSARAFLDLPRLILESAFSFRPPPLDELEL